MKIIKRIIAALLLCFVCVTMSACGAEDGAKSDARPKKTATFTTPDGELVEVVVDSWMSITAGMVKLYLEDGSWIMVGAQNVLLRQEAA